LPGFDKSRSSRIPQSAQPFSLKQSDDCGAPTSRLHFYQSVANVTRCPETELLAVVPFNKIVGENVTGKNYTCYR
jgi:hypothetical protein